MLNGQWNSEWYQTVQSICIVYAGGEGRREDKHLDLCKPTFYFFARSLAMLSPMMMNIRIFLVVKYNFITEL